jgi:hypothetical protein
LQLIKNVGVYLSKQKNKNKMKTADKKTAAIEMIGFDYFMNCIKNGATPEQAKAEMLTEKAQKEIAKRIKLITV